jgi:hypothetical protein
MLSFRQFVEDDDWDDFFKSTSTVTHREAPRIKDVILTLYRGFDPHTAKQEGDSFILSPERSEQGMLWFTHDLIGGHYNPIEYAAGHGSLFLTYPLHCKRHVETAHWSDGTESDSTPDYFHSKVEPTENCRFHMGYELPEGWVFSYKMEKFVGCTHTLRVPKSMVRPSAEMLG